LVGIQRRMTWRAARSFEPSPEQLRAVRRFVADLVDGWGLDSGDVVLVAHELAANAVVHARSPFTVEVSLDGSRVRVEVSDFNPRLPVAAVVPEMALSGRGLMMVARLSISWGVRAGDGKTVWAEMETGEAVG